jgi:hypothetical protein
MMLLLEDKWQHKTKNGVVGRYVVVGSFGRTLVFEAVWHDVMESLKLQVEGAMTDSMLFVEMLLSVVAAS